MPENFQLPHDRAFCRDLDPRLAKSALGLQWLVPVAQVGVWFLVSRRFIGPSCIYFARQMSEGFSERLAMVLALEKHRLTEGEEGLGRGFKLSGLKKADTIGLFFNERRMDVMHCDFTAVLRALSRGSWNQHAIVISCFHLPFPPEREVKVRLRIKQLLRTVAERHFGPFYALIGDRCVVKLLVSLASELANRLTGPFLVAWT
jgi:hypothetical protein